MEMRVTTTEEAVAVQFEVFANGGRSEIIVETENQGEDSVKQAIANACDLANRLAPPKANRSGADAPPRTRHLEFIEARRKTAKSRIESILPIYREKGAPAACQALGGISRTRLYQLLTVHGFEHNAYHSPLRVKKERVLKPKRRPPDSDLYRLYVTEGHTLQEIAPLFNVCWQTIREWAIKANIPLRGSHPRPGIKWRKR